MEQKLIIAEILKNKPRGTKLYSTVHGKCTFEAITDEIFKINFCTSKFGLMQAGECTLIKFGNMFEDGECIIFPSKEMRDWAKFSWKKGDVLVSEDGTAHLIFEKFTDDTYTTFIGRHYLNKNYKNYVPGRYPCVTQHFHIEESNAAQIYIYNIEKKIGGKLDLKTLEIEKPKCEFKTFDKVLGRNEKDDVWEADLFSHYREESQYPFRCIGFSRKYCIPYNKETAHLLGTTDDWEGGEQ